MMRYVFSFVVLAGLISGVLAEAPARPYQQSSEPDACPRPAYSMPEQNYPLINQDGQVVIQNAEGEIKTISPFGAVEVATSDDNAVSLIVTRDPVSDETRLWRYGGDSVIELHDSVALLALRDEEFAAAALPTKLQFIPGTHTALFYTTIISNSDGIYFEIPLDLWAIDADTSGLTEVLPYGEGGDFTVSPDGSYVVLSTFDAISIYFLNEPEKLTVYEGTVGVGAGESVVWPLVAFDPQVSGEFIVMLPDGDPYAQALPLKLERFEISAFSVGQTTLWTTEPTSFFGAQASPDGRAVAYSRFTGTANQPRTGIFLSGFSLTGEMDVMVAEAPNASVIRWLDADHVLIRVDETYTIADTCGDVNPLTLDLEGLLP